MHITIHALDKDSAAGYTDTLLFDNYDEFDAAVFKFEQRIPFPRYYFEVEGEDDSTIKTVEKWLSGANKLYV
jgi:hypothetical protein